jgi:hypothetical protein
MRLADFYKAARRSKFGDGELDVTVLGIRLARKRAHRHCGTRYNGRGSVRTSILPRGVRPDTE